MEISELERKISQLAPYEVASKLKNDSIYKVLLDVEHAGGESLLRKGIEIIAYAGKSGASDILDLSKKLSDLSEESWNANNIIGSIELVYYTYVEKGYGRAMSETIFNTFVTHSDKNFDVEKLEPIKRRLDEIYSENNINPFELKEKTEKFIQRFFK